MPKKEKLITRFPLPYIADFAFQQIILKMGYAKTGLKFHMTFNGSKGYLSNITIGCELNQNPELNQRIMIESLENKDGSLMKRKTVEIYHSPENGVRVEVL